MKFFRCDKVFEDRCYPVAGKSIGTIQNPCKLHGNLSAHETGLFRCKFRQQRAGRFRLPSVIIDQISHQNIGIKCDHLSFAPSATARSIS